MENEIKLYSGIEKSMYHTRRGDLLIFINGSIKEKSSLKRRNPKRFDHFRAVWKVRQNHMILSSLPDKYAFVLYCCGRRGCPHPRCADGEVVAKWSPTLDPIKDLLPIPEIDTQMNANCQQCQGACGGHYKSIPSPLSSVVPAPVPSELIKAEFENNNDIDEYERISRLCLVNPDIVKFYVDHLRTVKENRKRGVEKAKLTRAKKKKSRAAMKSN